ncbi:hypothetical protein BFJ65_g17827 [Fusarium oxysporum f. sp. cepae]|uniref:HAT C-terminal dimerisation domain-containing protein n=1 Tax=Fusarium oxysporum f. sp. cepae TaxID=396571 RepID=A0A3L6MRZ6_FUSOX|nr:hypothetical protein BFJ65_g17827 [Fusarium oxysporum f. sp. cepae]
MATLHPTKSTTPVPERTEEDNQRLFQLYKGWTLTERDGQVRQWVYQFGYDIQHADKGERRWVCCLCIKQKRPRPKSYAIKGLQNAEGHLYTDHNGIMDPTGKRQKPTKASEKAHQSIATILQLNPKEPKEQDLINTLIKRFDKTVFQQKLVNWIVNSNQSFSIVNDQDLRDIFNYLNPSVEITKANITDVTVRAIAEREFTNNMERVKDALRKSPGQIHIQYDGWKSGNRHALYGITCVFRDSNNRPQKCVLGLPELTERHTGENIAGQIIEIIREYEISDKLGYFTLDNAGNNKTSMGELGLEFGFDWEKRWVRCVGHVVNIVVKQMLYGKNPDAFEKEVFEGLHTAAKEHEVWRRRGSVGKWHNFALEVSRSDTWTDMLKKVQAVESQLSDDAQLKKHCPVGVVVDNATRWLSQFSMIERALVLRPFYNSFIQRASNEWEKVNLTRAGHIKKGSKLPFFLKEENRMTPDDWHVLGTLYDILLDFQLVVRGLEGDGQGKHRRKVEENEIDPPLSGTSWDLIHAYEFLLETLESAKRAVANFPDGHHLAVNINLGWLKLNEYYEHLNDSPLIYGAAVLHPAYRWALFDDLWGDDDERQLWITKAKEMVQDLWEREYRDLEVNDPEIELPANKRLKTSRNKFTAWRTKKRGLTTGGISVTESQIRSPAQSPRSSVGGLDLDEYEQWQRDIEDADASVTDPYEYWHIRRLKYPRLSRMALDLLTVPPMSAECERLFSTTGRMVTKSRNRLDASTIGLCQTLRSWLRAGLIGSLDRILMDE